MAGQVEVGFEKPRARCRAALRDVDACDGGCRPVSVAEDAAIEGDRAGDTLETLVRS